MFQQQLKSRAFRNGCCNLQHWENTDNYIQFGVLSGTWGEKSLVSRKGVWRWGKRLKKKTHIVLYRNTGFVLKMCGKMWWQLLTTVCCQLSRSWCPILLNVMPCSVRLKFPYKGSLGQAKMITKVARQQKAANRSVTMLFSKEKNDISLHAPLKTCNLHFHSREVNVNCWLQTGVVWDDYLPLSLNSAHLRNPVSVRLNLVCLWNNIGFLQIIFYLLNCCQSFSFMFRLNIQTDYIKKLGMVWKTFTKTCQKFFFPDFLKQH